MLDIILLTVGKIKDRHYSALAVEYLKRLKPYARIKMVELEASPFDERTKDRAKEFDAERIENFLDKQKGNRLVYLMAERGEEYDSPNLAKWLNNKNPLILVVGGALGFSDDLYKKYPTLSLSALTFPHELARVVLLEQIYRAVTILQNKSYHY